jgi:phosphohistidine phosphatase SixA
MKHAARRRVLVAAAAGAAALLARAAPSCAAAAADAAALRAQLGDGSFALLLRHAIAPGGGDPSGFVLGDCATQRNLSEEGRDQARRIGRHLAAAELGIDHVLASRWCRAQETARLLDLGPVIPHPALDSFFARPERGPAQLAAMRALLRDLAGARVVLVTHQVNITGLTGLVPRSGEAVALRLPADPDAAPVLLGTVPPP